MRVYVPQLSDRNTVDFSYKGFPDVQTRGMLLRSQENHLGNDEGSLLFLILKRAHPRSSFNLWFGFGFTLPIGHKTTFSSGLLLHCSTKVASVICKLQSTDMDTDTFESHANFESFKGYIDTIKSINNFGSCTNRRRICILPDLSHSPSNILFFSSFGSNTGAYFQSPEFLVSSN